MIYNAAEVSRATAETKKNMADEAMEEPEKKEGDGAVYVEDRINLKAKHLVIFFVILAVILMAFAYFIAPNKAIGQVMVPCEISEQNFGEQVVYDLTRALAPIGLAIHKALSFLPIIFWVLAVLMAIAISIYHNNRNKKEEDDGGFEVQDSETFGLGMIALEEAEAKEGSNILHLSQKSVAKIALLLLILLPASASFASEPCGFPTEELSANNLDGFQGPYVGTLQFSKKGRLTISYGNKQQDIIPPKDVHLVKNHQRALKGVSANVAKKEMLVGSRKCTVYKVKTDRFDFVIVSYD